MKNALLRLREASNHISEAERSVANHLLAHPEDAMNLSIHALADKTFSSPSTIIRLCHRLGFDGYKDFRRALTYALALRKSSENEQPSEITQADDITNIIEKITYKNLTALEDSKDLLDPETIAQCVALLNDAHTILLFGMGASLCAAKDAYLKFLRFNKPCMINDDWHSQQLQAKNATKEDVAILISYSGETQEVLQCMKLLLANGTPTIAITRCTPSSLSALARYNLYTTASESTFRSGAMSSRISQLNIIDILYAAYVNQHYLYCKEQLVKTYIPKNEKDTEPVADIFTP